MSGSPIASAATKQNILEEQRTGGSPSNLPLGVPPEALAAPRRDPGVLPCAGSLCGAGIC